MVEHVLFSSVDFASLQDVWVNWAIAFSGPAAEAIKQTAANSVDGLIFISEILTSIFAVASLALAISVWRSNPRRALNQILGTILLVTGVWQVAILVTSNIENGLPWLRLAGSLASFGFLLDVIFLDAILFHDAKFTDRLKTNWPLLLWGAFATIAPWTPWWIPYTSTREHPVNGPLKFWVNISTVIVPGILIYRSFKHRLKLTPAQKVELQNFIILNALVCSQAVIILVAQRAAKPWAHVAAVLLGAYYLITARMMADTRELTVKEAYFGSGRVALGFTARFVVIFAALLFLKGLSIWETAVTLTVGVLVVGYFSDNLAGSAFKEKSDVAKERTRQKIARLVSEEWVENRLVQSFVSFLRDYLPAERIEIQRCETIPMDESKGGKSLLINAAAKHGWISAQMAPKVAEPRALAGLVRAFDEERLNLVIVHRYSGPGAIAMLVELQSSISLISGNQIQFLTECLEDLCGGLERIRLARKALHNDRLATVGFLASQISHESRNKLEVIVAGLEMVKLGSAEDLTQDHRDLLHQTAVEFAADLNRSLEMARVDIGRLESANAHTVIGAAITYLALPARAANIEIVRDFCAELDTIYVDPKLLRQVLHNLLRNSSDAIKELPHPKITIRTFKEGDRFKIEVEDNGPGVPPEIHGQLFTEYCTTKATGTGLGLSFGRDALSMMLGKIEYLTPKGQPHARFMLTLLTSAPPAADGSVPRRERSSGHPFPNMKTFKGDHSTFPPT